MFSYRPPKSSVWGHALRGKDLPSATKALHALLATYFEPIQPNEGSNEHDFTCALFWKESVLPNTDWPEVFLKPENRRSLGSLCMVTLGAGSRISFPGGLTIPVSPDEPASFEFIRKFASDAPFKMSPKHFSVGLLTKENIRWRKADGEVLRRLEAVLTSR